MLPSHGRGIWPRDVLKKVSRGRSRVEAGNPGFPRLVQVTSELNIMVVNDDGITSRGLRELVDALRPVANIYVSAPDGEHTGASQSITITEPIRVYDFDYPGAEAAYAVTGTPTDCVKAGLQFFRERGEKVPKSYTGNEGWKALCDDPDVDFVYNCTPWEMHVPPAVRAMNNGKHVGIEVPAASTAFSMEKTS